MTQIRNFKRKHFGHLTLVPWICLGFVICDFQRQCTNSVNRRPEEWNSFLSAPSV
ncbi:MAG: hypothetical protein H6Q41_1906 [Deltaproteobacteria bacterium]|jgi:hypothetical protein|nr:hypothetical protein [Deltaproteobacteria bacterium]